MLGARTLVASSPCVFITIRSSLCVISFEFFYNYSKRTIVSVSSQVGVTDNSKIVYKATCIHVGIIGCTL